MPAPISDTTLDLSELLSLAGNYSNDGKLESAITLYQNWLTHNPNHPQRFAALFNCGCLHLSIGDYPTAVASLIEVTKAKPEFTSGHVQLATAYERAGATDQAVAVLLALRNQLANLHRGHLSDKVSAFRNIARISQDPNISETALKMAVELDATQLDLVHHWVNYRHSRCVWPVLQPVGALTVRQLGELMLPLFVSMTSDDPRRLFEASQIFMDREILPEPVITAGCWPPPEVVQKERLVVAYLSSDLRFHPIGYLMEDIFPLHDKNRYEIIVYNIGNPADDSIKQKIAASVSAWHEVLHLSDKELAQRVLVDGVDILLDINGHTRFQRPRLLAMKPAPIIVNWLGYPGSMGVGCHDYILADNYIIPESHEHYYAERVLRLPCYQPNSALWDVPQRYSKQILGLPENGMVYCCFNGMVKITPDIFDRWMTILKAVPDSVLWLRGSANDAPIHLRQEAEKRGVDPARLVVLEFMPHTEYYACHRYADLFLDTFPYGAHTTASDALRMGIPIVTLSGEGFPSRVCGSLLNSVGLPELVCSKPSDYIDLAIALGHDRQRLSALKQKLMSNLPSSTLFDTPGHVRHLEGLFETMWQEYCFRTPTKQ